jgi:hypothetical protein
MGKRKRSMKSKTRKNLVIIFVIAALIIAAFILFNSAQCKENPCKECKVVASCIKFKTYQNQTIMSFDVKNQNEKQGDCFAYVTVNDSSKSFVKNISLGIIAPGEKVQKKVIINSKERRTDFSIVPSCIWER